MSTLLVTSYVKLRDVITSLAKHHHILPLMAEEFPGDKLKKIRKELGISRREAARRSEKAVSGTHIGNLEDIPGTWQKASQEVITGLARAYNRSVTQLLTEVNGTPYPDKPNIFTDEVHLERDLAHGSSMIPEYDMLSAGPGGRGGEIIGYVEYTPKAPGEHVAYRISGDSMSPRIRDGDTVVIKVRSYSSPGNMIVCWTPDDGMVCKYLKEIMPDGTHVLTSHNSEYPPIWASEIRIYGLVVQIRENVAIINGNH